MTRLYGNYICHLCGQVPRLGFVYRCEQDHLDEIRGKSSSTDSPPLVADHGTVFDAQAQVAKSLGMNNSVIRQIRAGEYSFEQIECLLAQRRHVKDVIKQARRSPSSPATTSSSDKLVNKLAPSPPAENIIASAGSSIPPVMQQASADTLPMSLAGTPMNTPNTSTTTSPTKRSKKMKCNFQVCHACRPFFQDRAFMSLGELLNDELPAVTEDELVSLPVSDTNIVRELGLREVPRIAEGPHKYEGHTMPEEEGDDYVSEECTPTSSALSEDTSESPDEATLYPCPGSGQCLMYKPDHGGTYDEGHEDGRRAINHGFASDENFNHAAIAPFSTIDRSYHVRGTPVNTPFVSSSSSSGASSISLPETLTEPLTPITPRFASQGSFSTIGKKTVNVHGVFGGATRGRNYRATSPFGILTKDSSSSLGSEVDVDGGVALMEEAVETGTPDIVTDEKE